MDKFVNGVAYVIYGDRARREVEQSIASLLRFNDEISVTVITDNFGMSPEQNSRMAKMNLPKLVEYDRVLYLDADTRVNGNLSTIFEILNEWDMVIAPSKNQGNDLFAHIKEDDEKQETLREIENWNPIQLQAGVMAFDRVRCAKLFREWERQWKRWGDQDQAALLRALAIEPVRVWMIGRCWNGGKIIEHLFGRV